MENQRHQERGRGPGCAWERDDGSSAVGARLIGVWKGLVLTAEETLRDSLGRRNSAAEVAFARWTPPVPL